VLGDLDEAERNDFPNGGSDSVTMYAEVHKVVVGAGQPPVLGSTVLAELDLESRQDAMGR
jgi:hypothetical protein